MADTLGDLESRTNRARVRYLETGMRSGEPQETMFDDVWSAFSRKAESALAMSSPSSS